MKALKSFAIALLIAADSRAQIPEWANDSTFLPFLTHGQVLNLFFTPRGGPYGDLISTIYKKEDGKIIVLSGSIEGIQQMIQNEFQSGIESDFVKNQLPRILSSCLPSDRTEDLLTEEALRMIREEQKDGIWDQRNIDLLELPRTAISNGRWKIIFTSVNQRGDIAVKVYKGKLTPFEILSSLVLNVRDRALVDLDWSESRRRKMEADAAFEAAP